MADPTPSTAGEAGINSLGDLAVFSAWINDSIDHFLGIPDSGLAASRELQYDPSLSAMVAAGTGPTASATQAQVAGDVTQNVINAEHDTLAEQPTAKGWWQSLKDAVPPILKGLHWLPWLLGAGVAILAVLAVGYTARALK